MPFAVIKTGGKQYKVAEGDKVLVEKLDLEAGKEFDFEEVLLVARPGAEIESSPGLKIVPAEIISPKGDEQTISGSGRKQASQLRDRDAKIGQPLVGGAKVHAKILEQGRSDKKNVFKYHSKTRYKKKKGHRQPFTRVEILKIVS